MKHLGTLFFALIPLSIGLGAIGLLRGWLVLRKKDGERAELPATLRTNLWFVAVLATLAGLLGVATALGIFPSRIN